jgi:hypothetical protein
MEDTSIINGNGKGQYSNLITNLNTKPQPHTYRLAPSNPLNKASNFLNVPF